MSHLDIYIFLSLKEKKFDTFKKNAVSKLESLKKKYKKSFYLCHSTAGGFMKKIYALLLFSLSLISVGLFQNCSPSQFKTANSLLSNEVSPSNIFVGTYTENIQLNATAQYLMPKESASVVFEYILSGGLRPFCDSEAVLENDYESMCGTSQGYRIFSDGSIQRFYSLDRQNEYKYIVGAVSSNYVSEIKKMSLAIQNNDSKLYDKSDEVPPCFDAPVAYQKLFSNDGKEFILSKQMNCHSYLRYEDKTAVELSQQMYELSQKISNLKSIQNQVILEKNFSVGFAPIESPTQIKVIIYKNGRIVKVTKYLDIAQKQNTVEVVGYVDALTLSKVIKYSQVFFEKNEALEDLDVNSPFCADAPTVTYKSYFVVTSDFVIPPVVFKENASCHTKSIRSKSDVVDYLSEILNK